MVIYITFLLGRELFRGYVELIVAYLWDIPSLPKNNNHLQYQTCLILHQPSQANTLDPLEKSKIDAFFNFANPTWRIIPASSW